MKIKAWKISSDWSEASVIVFAATAGRAKTIGLKTEWFADHDFVEISVYRIPEADSYATDKESVLEGSSRQSSMVMRELGWHCIDESQEECRECGLYEFPDLPESEIVDRDENGEEGICVGCQKAQQSEEIKP